MGQASTSAADGSKLDQHLSDARMSPLGKRREIVGPDRRGRTAGEIHLAEANLVVALDDDPRRRIGIQQRKLDIRHRHVDEHEAAIDPGRDRSAGAHEVTGTSDQAPDIGVRRRLDRLKLGGFVDALHASENFFRVLRLDLGIGKLHGGARRGVGFEACHQLLQPADMLLRSV